MDEQWFDPEELLDSTLKERFKTKGTIGRGRAPHVEVDYVHRRLAEAAGRAHLGAAEARVLLNILAMTAGYSKYYDRLGRDRLAELAGVDDRNTSRTLKALEDKGFINYRVGAKGRPARIEIPTPVEATALVLRYHGVWIDMEWPGPPYRLRMDLEALAKEEISVAAFVVMVRHVHRTVTQRGIAWNPWKSVLAA